MNKSMTLSEFVQEASVFAFSKEYFDLVKESGEVQLMNIYLNANDFLVENANVSPDIISHVSRIFTEAGEDKGEPLPEATANEVKETFVKKAWNAIIKALKFILRPIKALGAMINASVNKLLDEDSKKKRDEILSSLKEFDAKKKRGELTPEEEEDFKKALSDFEKDHPEEYAAAMGFVKDAEQAKRRIDINNFVDIMKEGLSDKVNAPAFLVTLMKRKKEFMNLFNEMEKAAGGFNMEYTKNSLGKIDVALKEAKEMKDVVVTADELKEYSADLKEMDEKITAVLTKLEDAANKDFNKEMQNWFSNVTASLTELSKLITTEGAEAIKELNNSISDKGALRKFWEYMKGQYRGFSKGLDHFSVSASVR